MQTINSKISRSRRIAMVCIIIVAFSFLAGNLVNLQIIHKNDYEEAISSVSSRTSSIIASRGEIVDCYGNKLVYNEQTYSIVFDAAYFPPTSEQEKRNKIIISLIKLFEKNKLEWVNTLPLEFDVTGKVVFKDDCENQIKEMKGPDLLNLNEYATAENCFDALVEKFSLNAYSKKEALKIAAVCYGMKKISFSMSTPYTFGTNVTELVVSYIKENSSFYQGVDVEVVPIRTYTDGTIAPHILGMTGVINAEEYSELKDKGYSMTDTVGKSGVELAMEEYLKGTDGQKTVYTDKNGNRSSEVTLEPKQGDTVVLTIDSGMQKVAQDALKTALYDYDREIGSLVPSAGAVVVLNCKDASVLAAASFPTYDISTYNEDAAELNKNSAAPLWNRAFMSTYACGSTAKPSVAIAALEEGIIDEEFTVYCNGAYNYLGQMFKCEQAHDHIFVNVVEAIDESCNTFFMEVGRLVGIEKMNEYRTLLGLGQKTGIEVSEAIGVLDSPEYRTSINQDWLPGYTVQSAIGQAGNLFTPIQLANYVGTIANGGTRYRAHIIKSIKSSDYSETILENGAEIVCQTGISDETLDIVKRGMLEVGTTGYCAKYFRYLPVKVACKTGTSQEIRKINNRSVKINNGFLIAFAPYDNPEIAVAAVGEGMISGVYVAPVIAACVEYYCGLSDTTTNSQMSNVLIP